jgi:hypothetical protein
MSDVRNSLYRGHRFPAEVIGHAVWLCFRFPLSLRMVEDLLAARGVVVSYETVRRREGYDDDRCECTNDPALRGAGVMSQDFTRASAEQTT